MKNRIQIYADGACKGNPGKGGWGALLTVGTATKEIYGGCKHTTNNQMELTSALMALKHLKRACTVDLHMDSKYVIDGLSKWRFGWIKKGWKTSTGQDVKNKELWIELNELMNFHNVTCHWVKGHVGHAGNEKADQLANKGCECV